MYRKLPLLSLAIALLSVACGQAGADKQVRQAADAFAAAYFDYDLAAAIPLCTPESERWLRFAASSISEADLDVLRSMDEGADASPSQIESLGDTVATVSVAVDNYMQRDTIGRAGHVVDGQVYHFRLVQRGGKWLVSLDGLPRAGQ